MKRRTTLVTALFGLSMLAIAPAQATSPEVCIPVVAQPEVAPVYETVVVSPAVEAVTVTEYAYTHKNPNHPQSPRWYTDAAWNAESIAQSTGWSKTGESRVVVVTPAQAEVTEQRLVTPGTPAVGGVECPEVPVEEPEEPTVPTAPEREWTAWQLAPGSQPNIGDAFDGGDQTFVAVAPTKAALIALLTDKCFDYQLDQLPVGAYVEIGNTLSKGEDAKFRVGGNWGFDFVDNDVDCSVPPVAEEPPVQEPPAPPATPEAPPVAPEQPEVVNPGAVTGLTVEALAALPAEQREYVEQYAAANGVAPTEVLVEWG